MVNIEFHIKYIRDIEKFRDVLSKPEFILLKIRSSIVMDSFKKQHPKEERHPLKGKEGFLVIGTGSGEKIKAQAAKFEDFILSGVLDNDIKRLAEGRIMAKLRRKIRNASINIFQKAASKTSPLMLLNMLGITVEWKIKG